MRQKQAVGECHKRDYTSKCNERQNVQVGRCTNTNFHFLPVAAAHVSLNNKKEHRLILFACVCVFFVVTQLVVRVVFCP